MTLFPHGKHNSNSKKSFSEKNITANVNKKFTKSKLQSQTKYTKKRRVIHMVNGQ